MIGENVPDLSQKDSENRLKRPILAIMWLLKRRI
jgi:hypothetical protein